MKGFRRMMVTALFIVTMISLCDCFPIAIASNYQNIGSIQSIARLEENNASRDSSYYKTVDEYVERLTEIKNSGDNAVEDDFRCSMCPTYEKFKDITGVGFLITIIHFFIHFANYIAFVS